MATISNTRLPETWPVAAPDFKVARKVEEWLQNVLAVNQALENMLVDVVAAFTPWIAPLVPAAIGWNNVHLYLHFDPWLAWIYAAVVEFLGLATVTTALQFWSWNQNQDDQAPFALAFVTALFYLAIVISVNVLLDEGDILIKIVKALASTFSIVGALTLAMRSQQAKRLAKIAEVKVDQRENARLEEEHRQHAEQMRLELARLENEKEIEKLRLEADEVRKDKELARKFRHEEKLAEIAAKVSVSARKVEGNFPESGESFGKVAEGANLFPETFGKWSDWRQVPVEQRQRIGGMTIKAVRTEYGIPDKNAGNWIKNAKKELGKVQ